MLIPVSDSNRTHNTSWITITLIFINLLVFLLFNFGSNLKIEVFKYGMIPWEITHFENISKPVAMKIINYSGEEVYTPVYRTVNPFFSVLASIFIHASFLHITWNMLFLWVFGRSLEDKLGKVKFLSFYIIGGLCASFIHYVFNYNSSVPVVGASGAVSAIMGAYLVLFSMARIKTLIFILFFITFVDIPAVVFLLIWFIFQFSADPSVAWLAHVGGFLAGVLFIKQIKVNNEIKGEENDQNYN